MKTQYTNKKDVINYLNFQFPDIRFSVTEIESRPNYYTGPSKTLRISAYTFDKRQAELIETLETQGVKLMELYYDNHVQITIDKNVHPYLSKFVGRNQLPGDEFAFKRISEAFAPQ